MSNKYSYMVLWNLAYNQSHLKKALDFVNKCLQTKLKIYWSDKSQMKTYGE